MEENKEVQNKKELNPLARLFIIGFLVGVALLGTFYMGARFACWGGYVQGFQCVEPKVVSACEFKDGSLIMVSNLSALDWEVVPLYKELNESGNLSDVTYTLDNGTFTEVNVSQG